MPYEIVVKESTLSYFDSSHSILLYIPAAFFLDPSSEIMSMLSHVELIIL